MSTPTGLIGFLEIKAGESRLVKSALSAQNTNYLPSSSFRGLTGELGKTRPEQASIPCKPGDSVSPALAVRLLLAANAAVVTDTFV